jgi:hypothetical protein
MIVNEGRSAAAKDFSEVLKHNKSITIFSFGGTINLTNTKAKQRNTKQHKTKNSKPSGM